MKKKAKKNQLALRLQVNNFADVREQVVDSRSMVVVDGTIIVEGVLNGFYVPASEFMRHFRSWNGVPVVINHPQENGGSAGVPLPDVPIVGRFYNADFIEEESKLVGEFWFDILHLEEAEHGSDILANIRNGNKVELSTGYFADEEYVEGVFDEVEYYGIHRNLRPDHIAVLPTSKGACSVEGGCGLNQNVAHDCKCGKHTVPAQKAEKEKFSIMSKKIAVNLLRKLLPEALFAKLELNDEETVEIDVEAVEGLLSEEQLAKLNAEPVDAEGLAELRLLSEAIGGVDGAKALMSSITDLTSLAETAKLNADNAKSTVIANIIATGQKVFTQKDLEAMELPAVQNIARLVVENLEVDYVGLGGGGLRSNEDSSVVTYAKPVPVLLPSVKEKSDE